jgi:hypothetical protein
MLSEGEGCLRVISTCSRLLDSYSSASCSFLLAFFSFFRRFWTMAGGGRGGRNGRGGRRERRKKRREWDCGGGGRGRGVVDREGDRIISVAR